MTKSTVTAMTGADTPSTLPGTSKAGQDIVAKISYTDPTGTGSVKFLYSGNELLEISDKVDLTKGGGAGTDAVNVTFKMPAKDVTLTAKAVAVKEINATFTQGTYLGTFKSTNDISAVITNPTNQKVTDYAGEVHYLWFGNG